MAIDDHTTLTTITSTHSGWSPAHFEVYQLRDYLDVRAKFSTTLQTVMRLMANRDLHLYGELVLHDAAVRTFETMGVTCVDATQDIVSFRSGKSAGEEKLRIKKDGTVQAAVGNDLQLAGSSIVFQADDSGTSTVWGTMDFSSGSPELDMTSGSTLQPLSIIADSVTFTVGSSSKTVQITSSGDISAPGFVSTIASAGSPPGGGSVGAMYVDTGGKFYVKVAAGTWKHVDLIP